MAVGKGTVMKVDLSVAQLLCSRLCHDLVGPLGAVNTGLELLDEGLDADGQALELIAKSGSVATRRLAFFRIAFGHGAGTGGTATLTEARTLAAGLLAEGKVGLDWPENADAGPQGPVLPAVVKVILNMVLVASESLPKGGTVGLRFAELPEGLGVAVTAEGQDAKLRDDIGTAMADGAEVGELTARNVHGYFAQTLARDLGALIEPSSGQAGEIRLAAIFPSEAD
ncbi:MAG: hypothetical protein IIC06_00095 [Proteobacteria bacterium]|nr:hypothetical protein [Pseudomonadota bacterium]